MNRPTLLKLFLVSAVAAGCASTPSTPRVNVANEETAITTINRQMQQAVASKNLDAVTALYATDAVLMAPNTPPARGQPAVREWWAQTMNLTNPSVTLTSTKIDVAASGDLATDVGTYAFTATSPEGPINDRGKYMVKFRKIGSDWKIASDIFNSDLPVQTPAPVAFVVIEPAGDDMTMNAAKGMSFQPIDVPGFKPGMQIAVVHGDPMGKGDYTIRLRFPAGYTFPAHYHPNAEHLTVLTGSFQLAMGEKEGGPLHDYAPGDFLYIPPKKPHYGGAKTETVIQLHGIGPFEIKLAQMASSEK